MRYFLHRLARSLLLLAGVSVLAFLMFELAPGDYFSEMRLDPRISPESVAAMRARYGLDQPLTVRYWRWLGSAARGELGYSFAYGAPAGPMLWAAARRTALLNGAAMLLAWLIAVPLGAWCAARRGRWPDRLATAVTGTLVVVPDVLLVLALVMLAVRTRWLPAGGMTSPGGSGVALHMVLPVTALVLGSLPVLVRHVRAAVAETLETPFLRAARAHGIGPARLLFRHALPAAANPLTTLFGFSLGALVSGSLVVEAITNWPGLGTLLLNAILARDVFVVLGGVLLSTVFLLAGNFAADLLLYALDPRIRRPS
ncbi:MAG: ABC transporter permease [Bryobacteraceae bacterium]